MTSGVSESIALSDAIHRYLMHLNPEARTQSQTELNRFIRWLGGHRTLDGITSHEVATYPEKLGNATDLSKRLECVKGFLAYCKKEGYTTTNLGVNLRVKKSPTATNDSAASKDVPVEKASLTREGYDALVAELEGLKGQRPAIAEALHLAMADKDFRENAPLDAARDQQAHLEARIRELEAILKRVEIMEGSGPDTHRVQLGSVVVVHDAEADEDLRFTLVHSHEANLGLGKLSVASPLGKAVLDHGAGDEVEVAAPGGQQKYRITSVEPGSSS